MSKTQQAKSPKHEKMGILYGMPPVSSVTKDEAAALGTERKLLGLSMGQAAARVGYSLASYRELEAGGLSGVDWVLLNRLLQGSVK